MKSSVLRSTIGLAALVVMLQAMPAVAQSKCDAGKLKEYGKKVLCLAKVDSTAARKGAAPDITREDKCIQKFTEKCTKAEGQGDCTGAVLDCATLATEAETCRDSATVPVCEDFGGVPVGGFCWFLGAFGSSCDGTCAAAGGLTYDIATRDYAGSGGTDQQCVDVLDALSAPLGGGFAAAVCIPNGLGCLYAGGVTNSRVRCTDTTISGASDPEVQRACACQLP